MSMIRVKKQKKKILLIGKIRTSPILVFLESVTVSRLGQSLNARSPMYCRPIGRVIVLSPSHPSNTLSQIILMLSGRKILTSLGIFVFRYSHSKLVCCLSTSFLTIFQKNLAFILSFYAISTRV